MRDAGHRTPDIGHRTAQKAKIIYPPPRGVDIMMSTGSEKKNENKSSKLLYFFKNGKMCVLLQYCKFNK